MRSNAARHATLAPISRVALSDDLVAQIRGSIDAGRYRAGDRLPPIGELARAFAVGRGAVREALTKLHMLRIVEVRHGLGAYVIGNRP